MKLMQLLYWVFTLLICSIMLYSAGLYFTKNEMIKGFFKFFNYPTYIVYPLATLKILGVIMILWRKNLWLTEWAYAGFFFDVVLATAAHYYADHSLGLSALAIPLILGSYFLGKRVRT